MIVFYWNQLAGGLGHNFPFKCQFHKMVEPTETIKKCLKG